jgi:cysteine protease ATG4
MTTVDFGPYKRIVQYFYDPAPKNIDASKSPIWCLGQQHDADPKITATSSINYHRFEATVTPDSELKSSKQTETPPESLASSVDSNLAYDETSEGNNDQGGWPPSFLDDFESKIWFTYRSNFPPIARSQDPKASSAMTFAVRIRSQLGDKGGFTSDTGFGCMIRSGQSLLANSILKLRLGRGKLK